MEMYITMVNGKQYDLSANANEKMLDQISKGDFLEGFVTLKDVFFAGGLSGDVVINVRHITSIEKAKN